MILLRWKINEEEDDDHDHDHDEKEEEEEEQTDFDTRRIEKIVWSNMYYLQYSEGFRQAGKRRLSFKFLPIHWEIIECHIAVK